jgi:hypothetical protein
MVCGPSITFDDPCLRCRHGCSRCWHFVCPRRRSVGWSGRRCGGPSRAHSRRCFTTSSVSGFLIWRNGGALSKQHHRRAGRDCSILALNSSGSSAGAVARLVSMSTCSLSWAGAVPGRRRAALGGFDGDGWEAGAGQSGRVNPRAGVRYRVASIGGPPPDLPRTRLGARGAVSLGFAGRAASRMPTS